MQTCSLGADSLGSHGPPLVLASPNTKAKLLLLERRLTGSNHQAPHSTATPEASSTKLEAANNDQMLGAALAQATGAKAPVEIVVIDGTQDDVQREQLVPAAPSGQQPMTSTAPPPAAVIPAASGDSRKRNKSPTPPLTDMPASASKRRKTGKPQHRPVSADLSTPTGSTAPDSIRAANSMAAAAGQGAAAASGGKEITQQRDKGPRARASPRAALTPPTDTKLTPPAAAMAGELGNSNPPMSPISGGLVPGIAMRTPRSNSKHGVQHPGRGQQNISKFFPLLGDGNSRDSETASLQQQQHQQQHWQQQSPLKDTADQHKAGAGLRGSTPPPPAAAAAADAAADGSIQPSKRSKTGNTVQGSGCSSEMALAAGALQQQLAMLEQKHQQELEQQRQEARQREGQLTEQLSTSQRQVETLQGLLQQLQQELAAARSSREQREGTVQVAVSQLVVQLAVAQGSLSRMQLSLDGSRLGSLGLARNGALGFAEVWEDGPVLRDLAARKAALQRSREEVDVARKVLKKRLPPPPKATLVADSGSSDAAPSSNQYISSAEYVMQDEILKVRLSVLKREEEQLAKEEERLHQDKLKYLRLLKRLRDEDASRFQGQPTLNQRYVLLALLGRGGFSEVHKAYDLQTLKFVAVKIHQLNSTWSESRKASYVRHAVREYTIHKALRHSNIVSLTDIFEVDNTTFATVLELCEGGDLEARLQQFQTLPEREARALIAQVFAGLAYLNRAPSTSSSSSGAGGEDAFGPRVIHYDLKPANILFDSLGTVKITDFGLSKVVEDGQTMGMELTSQGAGTYWYLPPECFQTSSNTSTLTATGSRASLGAAGLLPAGLLNSSAVGAAAAAVLGGGGPTVAGGAVGAGSGAPRISNKVDVWSAGVILYQMLYGKRPFGEGLTQEQIYRDGVMLNARQVQFPAKPAVSAEGRAFLSHCLAYNQEERWDVLTAAADPYLQLKR